MFKLVLIPGMCVTAAFAQTPTVSPDLFMQKQILDGASRPVSITLSVASPMATIAGAPYSAQAVTQRIQMLGDGNRIMQTTTNSVARDGKGRIYREESVPAPANANADEPHLVLIEDPVAGVNITLDSSAKTALKRAAAQLKTADETAARNGIPPLQGGTRTFFSSAGSGSDVRVLASKVTEDAKVTHTDLGTQMVEGVVAKGTRITRTIAAGDIGNDLPIVITTETWYSPDLKLLVMSKSVDPRMGETTYKLTNISRAEPDPALFQIPADYKVTELPQDAITLRRADK